MRGHPRRCACGLLNDRRRRGDLRLIAHLRPERRIGLHRRHRGGIRQGGGLAAGSGLRAPLKRPQAFFELAVTVLQFLVLPGELPELIFKLLNPDLRVDILGLREGL